MFKPLFAALFVAASLSAAPVSAAIVFGVNASTPLGGYDLGDGRFATKIGLQSNSSFIGEVIAVADLNNIITSGSVSAWYYAAGNPASSLFGQIDEFAPFVADTVVAGNARPNRVWDSLFAIHTSDVVFSNGTGGTATMGTGGARLQENPFERIGTVPEPSSLALIGLALAGLGLTRRLKPAAA